MFARPTAALLLATCAIWSIPANASGAPVVLYTDIASGPNSGGENDKGIYLSIFGKNFGTSGAGTTTRVYLNDREVDNYRYLGPSKGRADIQQITVQLGALGHPQPGVPLPVKLTVNGVASNTDLRFTVWPGNIYFVDNLKGVDTADTVSGGTFTHPFKSVQKKAGARLGFAIDAATLSGAWGRVRAGDFIVMRGTGVPWNETGFGGYFLQTLNKSGCPIVSNCVQGGGMSSGPITIMGYPGEDVRIENSYDATRNFGAISSADSARIAQGMGAWITVANLRIEGGNHDGAVNTQAGGSHWRVVNNDLSAATAVNNANAKAGGIAGSGLGQAFLGNRIHDVYCGPPGRGPLQNHGIYLDGAGSYEIAYNLIEKIPGGNGLQIYVNRETTVDEVDIHHNLIRDVGKHGINIADGAGRAIAIYNNVVAGADMAALRFNSTRLSGAKIINNTFWNTDRVQAGGPRAALMNDAAIAAGAVEIRNNIVVPGGSGRNYVGGAVGFAALAGDMSHNLWHEGKQCLVNLAFNGRGCVAGSHNLHADPRFVSTAAGAENLRLKAGSPAIDAAVMPSIARLRDDFDAVARRPAGAAVDIGAYEFER